MKDPAFQSQQFADNVQQRKEQYILHQGQAIGQGALQAVDQFMQGQRNSQIIANQEAERQQSIEALNWAHMIHGAKQAEYLTRGMKADVELKEAQTERLRKSYEHDMEYDDLTRLTPERMAGIMLSTGKKPMPTHGGVDMVDITPEERTAAQKMWSAYEEHLRHPTPTAESREDTALLRAIEEDDLQANTELADRLHKPSEARATELRTRLSENEKTRTQLLQKMKSRRGLSGPVETNEGTKHMPESPQDSDDAIIREFREWRASRARK